MQVQLANKPLPNELELRQVSTVNFVPIILLCVQLRTSGLRLVTLRHY